jgi:CMP-N-acetylneuraminic acid synthetase
MKTYAFVFARGGSKGLPGKNIKSFHGKPLIAYSIQMAHQLSAIAEVFVSTDCEEIASVAKYYSAQVIMRPPELATDTALEWFAWRHAVTTIRNKGDDFDVFLSLPATSPLRSETDVDQCLNHLDAKTDGVIAVTHAHRNPYFNMVIRDDDAYSNVVLNNNSTRRQDAPKLYDITTVAYVTRPDFILNNNRLFDGQVKSVIVPKERSIDIDDLFDFKCAEALYNAFK